jgi:phage/conjugal plasmid C-4 type zinc finger TraR family protein
MRVDDADLASEQTNRLLSAAAAAASASLRVPSCISVNCHGCDKEIPEGRRRALPAAVLCIECQQVIEETIFR